MTHRRLLLVVMLTSVLTIAVIIGVSTYGSRQSCARRGDGLGYPSRYDLWAGCQLYLDERWIPENRLVVTEDGTILEVTTTRDVPA